VKRVLVVGVLILILCSLTLVEIANAGNAAYSMIEYQWIAGATIDGKWTTADEWNDGPLMVMSENASFTYNIDMTTYTLQWVVEFFTDNTTDAGDLWQLCFDDTNGGGTAPQPGDYMIEIVGHTTLKTYQGNGTAWDEFTLADSNEITWANTISNSTWNSTDHWILEVSDVKTTGEIQIPTAPPTGMRVAAYDANTTQWASWAPDSDANVPDEWGVVSDFSETPIPEGFSLVAVLLLSSIAVIVGFYFLRKRPKTKSYISGKKADINYTS